MKDKIYSVDTFEISPFDFVYNPSIVQFNGKILMFFRREIGMEHLSDICLIELDDNLNIIKDSFKKIELKPPFSFLGNISFEDPRVFVFQDKLFLSCSIRSKNWNYMIPCYELDKNFKVANTFYFDYGNNLANLSQMKNYSDSSCDSVPKILKKSLKWEKNWTFFENNNRLGFVYSIYPHKVVFPSLITREPVEVFETDILRTWIWGQPRGGTPPILIGDQYFSFFHSVIRKGIRKKYYIGVYSFSSKPPYNITAISKKPLMVAKDFTLNLAVLFPSGVFFKDGEFIMSYGYNDHSIKIIRLDYNRVIKNMISTPNLGKLLKPSEKNKQESSSKSIAKFFNDKYLELDALIGKLGIKLNIRFPNLYLFIKRLINPKDFIKYRNSKKEYLGYLGWIGKDNIGDEASFEGFKDLFKGYNVLPYNNDFLLKKNLSFLRKLKLFKAVFLGGGTLMGQRSDSYYDFYLASKERNNLFIFGNAVRTQRYLDAIKSNLNHHTQLSKEISVFNNAFRIFVRGENSRKMLIEHGSKKTRVIGDIALSCCKPISLSNKAPDKSKVIGINLGCHTLEFGDQKKINDEVLKAVFSLKDFGWKFEFIPLHEKDYKLMSRIAEANNLNIKIPECYKSVGKTLELIKKCHLIIGQRLHSYVLASGLGIPSIPLEYSTKSGEFLKQMGLKGYAVRTDKISKEVILEKFNKISQNYPQLRKNLVIQGNYYRQIQQKAAQEISNLLDSGNLNLRKIFIRKKIKNFKNKIHSKVHHFLGKSGKAIHKLSPPLYFKIKKINPIKSPKK